MNILIILILGFSVFCTFAGFFLGVYGFTRFLKAITEEEFVPVVSFLSAEWLRGWIEAEDNE